MDLVSILFLNDGEQHIMILTLPLPPKDKKSELNVALSYIDEKQRIFELYLYVFKALLAVRKIR